MCCALQAPALNCEGRFVRLDPQCMFLSESTEEGVNHTMNPNAPFGVDPVWSVGHTVSDVVPSAYWNNTPGSDEVGSFVGTNPAVAGISCRNSALPKLAWLNPLWEGGMMLISECPHFWCSLQIFNGSPHAWYPRSMVGYPEGFPVWFPRSLTEGRMHFLFAYLSASGYLANTYTSPEKLTMKVRGSRSRGP